MGNLVRELTCSGAVLVYVHVKVTACSRVGLFSVLVPGGGRGEREKKVSGGLAASHLLRCRGSGRLPREESRTCIRLLACRQREENSLVRDSGKEGLSP